MKHDAEIKEAASRYGLDPYLVSAICMQESGGNTWATRMEFTKSKNLILSWRSSWSYFLNPHSWSRKIKSSENTEWICQASSWGLMQVMGTVARELGHQGWLSELCDPKVGIDMGCKHLKNKINRYNGDVYMGVAAYNAGVVSYTSEMKFRNQKYVDSVMKYRESIRDDSQD